MTNKEVMQQALEALESGLAFSTHSPVLQNLRAALAMHQVSEFAQAQEQQAEPTQWRDMVVVSLVREGVNKHKARELADHFAAQQQAEPVATVTSETGNPDITMSWWHEPALPVGTKLYTVPPQRPWVGLTDEDVNRESAPIAQQMKLAFHAGMYVAQKILKERNT